MIKWSFFQFKLCIGLCLFLWCLYEFLCIENENRNIWKDPSFKLFMCLGDYILLLWMWGASVYVWRKDKVDFVQLLTLDTTDDNFTSHESGKLKEKINNELDDITIESNHLGHIKETSYLGITSTNWSNLKTKIINGFGFHNMSSKSTPEMAIFDESLDMSIVYLVCLCFYMKEVVQNTNNFQQLMKHKTDMSNNAMVTSIVDEHVKKYSEFYILYPVVALGYFLYKLIFPWKKRVHYFRMLFQVLFAPLYPVFFIDSYIGDILTSLVRVLLPTVTLCVYAIHAIFNTKGDYYSSAGNHERVDGCVNSGLNHMMNGPDCEYISNVTYRLHLLDDVEQWNGYKYGVVPLVTLLPLWLRFIQCIRRSLESGHRFPHFANALKYTSALSVIALATFQPSYRQEPLWVLGFIGATLYQYVWDITMDWGLISRIPEDEINAQSGEHQNVDSPVDTQSSPNTQMVVNPGNIISALGSSLSNCYAMIASKLLPAAITSRYRIREQRLLSPLGIYPTIIFFNLIFRFSWALTLLPWEQNIFVQSYTVTQLLFEYLVPVMAAVEVVRRMAWGFLRVEWEHIAVFGSSDANETVSMKQEEDTLLDLEGDISMQSVVDNEHNEVLLKGLKECNLQNNSSDFELGLGERLAEVYSDDAIVECDAVFGDVLDKDIIMEPMATNTSGTIFSNETNSTLLLSMPYIVQSSFNKLCSHELIASVIVYMKASMNTGSSGVSISIFLEAVIFTCCVLIIICYASWPVIFNS